MPKLNPLGAAAIATIKPLANATRSRPDVHKARRPHVGTATTAISNQLTFDGFRSRYAGLLFVLNDAERLGISRWLARIRPGPIGVFGPNGCTSLPSVSAFPT
jgi:hypothetical protein